MARERQISVSVNGAELLRIERERASTGARSRGQYVRYRCGLPAALLANASLAPEDLGVRRALERRTISFGVSDQEYASLRDQASLPAGPGLTISQYVRTRLGLPVRHASNLGTSDRDREEDEAWDILRGLGLQADDYFEE